MFSEPSETGSEGVIKCPREQLVLPFVQTTLFKNVVAFVLQQMTERTSVLLDIAIDLDSHSQSIGVLLEPECKLARAKLAIEKYPAVLSVELIDHADRSRFALSALVELSKRRRHRAILGHSLR
jgi:hypothetical protein